MEQPVRSVEMVSDGILVAFGAGTHCYFSAEFLLRHAGQGSNQIFLSYDEATVSDPDGMSFQNSGYPGTPQGSQSGLQEGR